MYITFCVPCGYRFILVKRAATSSSLQVHPHLNVKIVSSCRRERDNNTPVKSTNPSARTKISPEMELVLPDLRKNEVFGLQLETIHLNGVSIMEMVHSLFDAVAKLSDELSCVKSENQAMRLQLKRTMYIQLESCFFCSIIELLRQ